MEYVMQNGVLVPGTSRRTFMKVLGTLFTGAVVAPVIIPYGELMHIDSPTNKLIFAYRDEGGGTFRSFLNLGDCLDPIVRAQWEAQNKQNRYEFIRLGELPAHQQNFWGAHYLNPSAPTTKEYKEGLVRDLKNRIARFRSGERTFI